jgi:hypothetical protein
LAQNTKTRKKYKNDHKIYKMATKIPYGRKIEETTISIPTSSIARPYKFTQIRIFGLKINHLATLITDRPNVDNKMAYLFNLT